MKNIIIPSTFIYGILLVCCNTATITRNDPFSATTNFSSFVDGTAEIGRVYAITGQKVNQGDRFIVLQELVSRVHTIAGNEEKTIFIRCEYPIEEILNRRSRLYDVLFVYEGREFIDRSSGSGSLHPRTFGKVFARGELIGTKDWHHPRFEKEWNVWAKVDKK